MNPSAPFIRRPVATTLLTVGVTLAGFFAFLRLPVAPLPQVDYPTITVSASMPGASPATMAATVATPLERHLGIIADVTAMSSESSVGITRITLQFSLNRSLNGAARDVQAAINATRADLPTSLRQNPSYDKVNPAAAPVAILAMTSETLTRGQIYDAASRVVQQALSQIEGVGQVQISGSSLPAVRVELNPLALFKYGIGLEDVRAALASANAHSPKGAIEDGDRRLQIYTNDKSNHAEDYRPLVIAYRDGAAVRLSDVAEIEDSVENVRNQGLADGKPAVVVILRRQPGANVIDTVERIKAVLPQLEASIPRAINVELMFDRTMTIRSSLREIERTLVIAVCLVVLVVFAFLRSFRAALIPSVAVPVSVIGTFGVMYLLGYSLDNLSLMALTISTGFVVDDAIVVLENVTRHIEAGMPRMRAALQGARGRFHRAGDDPLSRRRLRADPADGWHRRAAVPGVRGDLVGRDHDLAGRLADHDADDVRLFAGSAARRWARQVVRRWRAGLCCNTGCLRPLVAPGLAMAWSRHAQPLGDIVLCRASLHQRSKGVHARAR